MPFEIIRQDITKMKVDAIVNASNTQLIQGGGVCGAIFAAAGESKLQAACNEIGHCAVGQAVITPGFALPARHVIHTVGPVWQGGTHGESELLESCYLKSLQLARANNCHSIAFPLISGGIYGYPKDQALKIAVQTIRDFLLNHELAVYLVVFEKSAVVLSQELQDRVRQYIDDHYVKVREHIRSHELLIHQSFDQPQEIVKSRDIYSKKINLPVLEETFSQRLLRLITEKKMTDVQVYKRANLDRKLFSKIRSDVDYQPKKLTAVALGIALELSISEMSDFLKTAGYTLSHSNQMDVIIEYFINANTYNIDEINYTLFTYDQPTLGAN